ncbi:hypothetical protein ACMA5I_12150 [Paracoccaceae bacterium GXU_MW_L88]
MHWLFRMRRWIDNPPSARHVRFVLIVIAIAAVIVAIEYFGFWPDSLTAERQPRTPRL